MDAVQRFIGMNRPTQLHSQQAPAVPLPHPAAGAKPMEAMMRDEIFDREYQAGRDALNDGIDRLVASIGQTFRLMTAIQFNAPWSRVSGRRPVGT